MGGAPVACVSGAPWGVWSGVCEVAVWSDKEARVSEDGAEVRVAVAAAFEQAKGLEAEPQGVRVPLRLLWLQGEVEAAKQKGGDEKLSCIPPVDKYDVIMFYSK